MTIRLLLHAESGDALLFPTSTNELPLRHPWRRDLHESCRVKPEEIRCGYEIYVDIAVRVMGLKLGE